MTTPSARRTAGSTPSAADDRALLAAVPATHPMAYRLAFWFMRQLFDHYLTTHIAGREHLPPPGVGAILAINHTSALDYVAGHALGRPGFVGIKREAAYRPLRWIGGIPVKRDEQDMTALRSMRAVLAGGHVLGIAPEGTRSRDGRLLPFDPGFVWLALKADVPVIPCAIHGAHVLLPPGRSLPRQRRARDAALHLELGQERQHGLARLVRHRLQRVARGSGAGVGPTERRADAHP